MTTNKDKKWITEINPKTGQISASWPPIFSREWTNNLLIALKESLFFSEIKECLIYFKRWSRWQVFRIEDTLFKYKTKIWNGHLLLWWYRLWVRKDEFHHSLSMDIIAMLYMSQEKREKYKKDLEERRRIAHVRGMNRNEPKSRISRLKEISKKAKIWRKLFGENYKSTENEHVTRESLNKDIDKILEVDHEIVFLPNIGIKLKIKK